MVLAISAPFMARTELMAWISSAAAKKEQAVRPIDLINVQLKLQTAAPMRT